MTTTRRRALAALFALIAMFAPTVTTAHAVATPQNPWYFESLRLEEIWEHTKGGGVTVAVVDSGVDSTLPELRGQVLDGADFTADGSGAHVDTSGHGTHMAALIAGTGEGGGIQGLAPDVKILPVRVSEGRDEYFSLNNSEVMAEGIKYAVENGADIINLSMVAKDVIGTSSPLKEAVDAAIRGGVLFVAGVGNEAEAMNQALPPASLDGVVGIGAVMSSSERSAYSTHGPQVALAAPGDEIPWHCDGLDAPVCLREEGGTSSATALASASAALIWSQHPDWTKNQVLRVMLNTAERSDDQRRDDYTGYGMVRPDRVIVDGEGDPGDPDSPPIFRDYEARLSPPATPSPSPEPESDPAAGPEPGADAGAASPAESSGNGSLPWLVGGGVVLVLVALTGWTVWRRRV
ncbi:MULTISPECIES: S8 family serine peptidase [Streptomyces]|uniref:Type VII secretion-associated serine protease mycosin n=1 Tax=Streptomyces harbinensis TaxID=1176198 RepID=A0A1I6RW65_9ACTN|nr:MULTISPECIES: S8 family serine peptidase [Streptomyces]SFS68708.1 type VII secretion-associated serine protease mycosin [Streptomyces harbinensis]